MRPWSRIVSVSALAFVVVLGGLTALRAWDLGPPATVQLLVIDAGAVLVVTDVAAHVARGENIGTRADEGIVLTSGPCLDFAASLFALISTVESPLRVAYPLIAGAAPTFAVGGVGTAVDYAARTAQKGGTAIGRTSQSATSPRPRVL